MAGFIQTGPPSPSTRTFGGPTLDATSHLEQPRLITPREAMRFQAMPDAWELSYSSQDERNALIGNAVPPLVARAMAMAVADALSRRARLSLQRVATRAAAQY